MIVVRRLVKRWLASWRLVAEFCHECGVKQSLVWTASADLWAAVTDRVDGGGVLCPDCFDKQALARGLSLRWVPVSEVRS